MENQAAHVELGRTVPRIAVVFHTFSRGGAERAIVNVIKGLSARGVRVDLITSNAPNPYEDELPVEVVTTRLARRSNLASKIRAARHAPGLFRVLPDMALSRWPRTLRLVGELALHLKRTQPDAVLATLPMNNVPAVLAHRAAGLTGRIVIREANTLSINHGNDLWGRLARRCYPLADRVVGISEGVRRDLIENIGLSEDIAQTIYNPVDRSAIARLAAEPVDHPYFNGAGPVIVQVARLYPQKDQKTLLEAFAHLRKTADARLIILGEGPLRAELEALRSRLGLDSVVDLPGDEPNPYRFMARAAMFVLSSRWEGLSNVLLEALACDCPVVATNCPSGPAEVLGEGGFGRLVPPGDPVALAREMEDVLKTPGTKPTQDWVTRFTSESIIQDYFDALGLAPPEAPRTGEQ